MLSALLLALNTLTVSCNSPAENVQAAREDIANAKADLEKANKEYRVDTTDYKSAIMDQITFNEVHLIKLKEKFATNTNSEYKDRINQLEQRNMELKIKIKSYSAERNGNWQLFKSSFSRDMDELGKALNDLTVQNVQ